MTDERTEKQREQDRAIVIALRAAQWELDTVAHDLGANRVTPVAWRDLLSSLDYLRDLVKMRSGTGNGPSIES